MKYVITLPEGELYSSGDKRYRLIIWSLPWRDSIGVDIHGIGSVFTIQGWVELTKEKIQFKYQSLSRLLRSDEEKEQLKAAKRDFKSKMMSYLIAFHDG